MTFTKEDIKKIPVLDQTSWLSAVKSQQQTSRENFKAMYSTWWNGIVTDPNLMLVPIDDHQVHRGDAVFEAIKAINNKIYLMDEHLLRLQRSAESIGLPIPFSKSDIEHILYETLKASGLQNAILRLFVSRGPGSFSTSPYDTAGSQFYLVVTKLAPIPLEKINSGFKIAISKIPPKDSWLAQIKSCNYLQNVLMKKEALDLNVDFTIGLNKDGSITEGSTENIIILTKNHELLKPHKENILLGTTMQRAFELSKQITEIKNSKESNITIDDLKHAQEVMMVGTTLDVISVTQVEETIINKGKPGLIATKLRELLLKDQL